MERRGMQNRLVCVIRFPDAGKKCSDKNDCAGSCMIDLGRREYSQAELARTHIGACQVDDKPFGCWAHLVNGKVSGWFCAD